MQLVIHDLTCIINFPMAIKMILFTFFRWNKLSDRHHNENSNSTSFSLPIFEKENYLMYDNFKKATDFSHVPSHFAISIELLDFLEQETSIWLKNGSSP